MRSSVVVALVALSAACGPTQLEDPGSRSRGDAGVDDGEGTTSGSPGASGAGSRDGGSSPSSDAPRSGTDAAGGGTDGGGGPDASTLDSGSTKKALGAGPCTSGAECASNTCFVGGQQSYCSLPCTQANAAQVCVAPVSGGCNNQGYCKKL